MGIVGGSIASGVCQTFKLGNGLSSSSSSSSNSINSTHQSGKSKDISIEYNDLNDSIKSIWRIGIPATNERSGSETLNFLGKVFTGSKFTHDGLLIMTKSYKYFVCQTYPIQFKKCSSYDDAIEKIKSRWSINKNGIHNQYGQEIYDNITISKIKNIVENLPNYYDLFTYNCQDFCTTILRRLGVYGI